MKYIRTFNLVGFVFLAGLMGCSSSQNSDNLAPSATASASPSGDETQSAEPRNPTEIPATLSPLLSAGYDSLPLWIAPHLPLAARSQLDIPQEFSLTEQAEGALLQLEVGEQNIVSRWVYALVAPFPTIPDGVSSLELRQFWEGSGTGLFADAPLLMDQNTLDLFSLWWGAPGEGVVQVLPADEILEHAWDNRPNWAIVAFESLDPRWKVLQVDEQSPIWKEFNPATYALSLPISLTSEDETLLALVNSLYGPASLSPLIPPQNIDPNKLTTVILTGVTALVRATAWEMEQKGITHPAGDIGELMRQADITHISNEVPFVEDCPDPDPKQVQLVFCSPPSYMQLLEAVGMDIVELTGDHFGDWGSEGMLYTLQLYDDYDIPYYGGGKNAKQARQALLLEHNGNRIAFIGCNAKGLAYATASDTQPGAVHCDFEWMDAEISRLRSQGYIVIVTFQHAEYYFYEPTAFLRVDFRGVAEAGAVIVSGSQAHHTQGMEFFDGALLMYGLGNLFFDQIDISIATGQALIARHVFYGGRHISTELISIVFVDHARPRFMTPEERLPFLINVFEASGW